MRNAQCTVCVSAYETLIAAVLFNYRELYRYRSRRKQRVNGLVPVPGALKYVPFSVGYTTEFVLVNRRFLLEPVLVSKRAVPSLLTCKRAFSAQEKK